jgi:hypothetical protein
MVGLKLSILFQGGLRFQFFDYLGGVTAKGRFGVDSRFSALRNKQKELTSHLGLIRFPLQAVPFGFIA